MLQCYFSLSSLVIQVALSEADSRCHDLEERNAILEGQVSDLGERLQLQSGADEQIMTLVNSKASQWQVRRNINNHQSLEDLSVFPPPILPSFKMLLGPIITCHTKDFHPSPFSHHHYCPITKPYIQ